MYCGKILGIRTRVLERTKHYLPSKVKRNIRLVLMKSTAKISESYSTLLCGRMEEILSDVIPYDFFIAANEQNFNEPTILFEYCFKTEKI